MAKGTNLPQGHQPGSRLQYCDAYDDVDSAESLSRLARSRINHIKQPFAVWDWRKPSSAYRRTYSTSNLDKPAPLVSHCHASNNPQPAKRLGTQLINNCPSVQSTSFVLRTASSSYSARSTCQPESRLPASTAYLPRQYFVLLTDQTPSTMSCSSALPSSPYIDPPPLRTRQ